MTYAFTQDVPIDAAFYKRITDGLGDEPHAGQFGWSARRRSTGRLITHIAIERPEGGLRYIDVWETEADCERFVDTRLHPVVHGLLSEIFGDDLPPEPERTPISVVHHWGN